MVDNVIEHEILKALKYSALKVTQTGSEYAGFQIVDKVLIQNTSINYSTLCDYLNNPNKYINSTDPFSLNKYIATTKDISFDKFDRPTIEKSVYNLVSSGDIIDTDINLFDPEARRLKLTPKGLSNFYSEHYLKQYNDEIERKNNQKITRLLSWAALIISLVSIIPSAISTYFDYSDHYNNESNTYPVEQPLNTKSAIEKRQPIQADTPKLKE